MLLVILIVIVGFNSVLAPHYLEIGNQINLLELHIEECIVALVLTFIIINAEIDLSVGSLMGLAGCVMAFCGKGCRSRSASLLLFSRGTGRSLQRFHGGARGRRHWLSSAGLIGYRGLAHVLLEDRSIGDFPTWFDRLGQQPLVSVPAHYHRLLCLVRMPSLPSSDRALAATFLSSEITARLRAIQG
jgi:rhamnose transport system permease protein